MQIIFHICSVSHAHPTINRCKVAEIEEHKNEAWLFLLKNE